MHLRAALVIFLCIGTGFTGSYGQKLQWASKLVFQYNQYGTDDYSGNKALGPPDAKPYGSLNKNAFRLKTNAGYGTLKVGFDKPVHVSQLTVVENNAPGNIVKVIFYDISGKEHVVYQEDPKPTSKTSDVFILKVAKTAYQVKQVAVHLNTFKSKKWAQIDAIAISEEPVANPVPEVGNQGGSMTTGVNGEAEKPVFHAKKERLSDHINTEYPETKPLISPDGKTLYFARKNSPENVGGKRDPQDIYYSTFDNGEWSPAKNIGRPLNDKMANGVCSVSPDGSKLVILGAISDGKGSLDGVSVSVKNFSGWSKPRAQKIDGFKNLCDYQDYYLSNSGKILILAIQMEESYGDQDLYVSFRKGPDEWTKPKNLGKTINTPQVEYGPFLASDNKTLYFSSDGHGGFGKSDIFYSKRLDDTWQNWSEPVNIGKEVNSPDWDGYYVVAAKGDYAYFVSSEDIYKIALREEVRPDPVILISGKVLNSETKKPVSASIFYESLPGGEEDGVAMTNPATGEYKIVLPVGKKYGFHAEADGYIATEQNEDFTRVNEYKEIRRDLLLTPMAVGKIIRLNNLFFVRSKAEILPESKPELDRIYKLLTDNPKMVIELGGHTDNQGYYSANVKLSQERADAVKAYLVEKGINKGRIKTKGYGPTKPIADNRNPEERKKNRRVEIKILKN